MQIWTGSPTKLAQAETAGLLLANCRRIRCVFCVRDETWDNYQINRVLTCIWSCVVGGVDWRR